MLADLWDNRVATDNIMGELVWEWRMMSSSWVLAAPLKRR
jgi:hypothetical protein